MKTFRVVYESKTVKALRDPSAAAQRIHLLQAKDREAAVKLGNQAEMRHAMRVLDELKAHQAAAEANGAEVTMDVGWMEARADVTDWKLKSAEEVK